MTEPSRTLSMESSVPTRTLSTPTRSSCVPDAAHSRRCQILSVLGEFAPSIMHGAAARVERAAARVERATSDADAPDSARDFPPGSATATSPRPRVNSRGQLRTSPFYARGAAEMPQGNVRISGGPVLLGPRSAPIIHPSPRRERRKRPRRTKRKKCGKGLFQLAPRC